MQRSNIYALQDSKLNTFLFASVGVEHNGSDLTILSILARLGKDPWTEAEAWAKLPTAAVVDLLTTGIGRMSLTQHSIQDARATASRLVELLPKRPLPGGKQTGPARGRSPDGGSERWWILICFAAYVLLMGVALAISMSFFHTGSLDRAPLAQPARFAPK